jgi:amidohydrolase
MPHPPESPSTAAVPTFDHWEPSYRRAVDRLRDAVVSFRRHLHAHPEPSGEEVETTRLLHSRLDSLGVPVRVCRSDAGREVGLIADGDVGRPTLETPRIAIRCDMDALRIPDEKDVDYRSRNDGVAHACGHDAHTAIVFGIAAAVAELNREAAARNGGEPPGMRLRFLFQPAEEISGGARWLVEQGAMDGVDAVIGLHVDPERPAGEVGIRTGVLTANCDEVDIEIHGHGGHAARPHHSHDPIAAASQLVAALYQQLPRAVDSRDPSVFTIGRINGGYAANVIPEAVQLQGTLRTIAESSRTTLKRRMREICDGVAQTASVTIDLRFSAPLNAVVNDPRIAAALESASGHVLGAAGVRRIDRPSLGGEDFSVYLERAPGALLRLGCATPGTKAPFLHSPLFDVDERCLPHGMRILFEAAVLLSDSSATERGKAE